MVKGIGGLGFLDSVHCEKTSFIAVGGFIGLAYFVYLAFVDSFPTIKIPFVQEPITLLFLFALVFTGGYLGVIFYRLSNHKCLFCKDSIMFWNAKA